MDNGTGTSADRDLSRHVVKYIFYNRPSLPTIFQLIYRPVSRCPFFAVRSTSPRWQKLLPSVSRPIFRPVFAKSVWNFHHYLFHSLSCAHQWISTSILCHRVKCCVAICIWKLLQALNFVKFFIVWFGVILVCNFFTKLEFYLINLWMTKTRSTLTRVNVLNL